MPPSIKFQSESELFLTEAEQNLLALERSPDKTSLHDSLITTLRTLRGVADLFNLDNANLALSIATEGFELCEANKETPAPLINETLTLIDRVRELNGEDFSPQEYDTIVAKFSPFAAPKAIKQTPLKAPKDTHILVVDDEEVNRILLVEFIKAFNPEFQITSVDSASEAIFLYLTKDFDLVFLDIMMPEVDGNHFISIVNQNRTLGNITNPANIIVQTAVQSLPELLAIVQKEPVLEVIRKPILRERITTCLTRYCPAFQA